MATNLIIPTDITRDELNDIASFSYYDGIYLAKQNNLTQTTELSKIRDGKHFIVCCGDVMIKVEQTEYPNIERRLLI